MTSSCWRKYGNVAPQPGEQLIAAQQPQGAQDAQEAGGLADQRRQERHDGGDVGPGDRMRQLAQPVAADEQPRGEVGQDDQAEQHIERSTRSLRGRNEVATMNSNGDEIEASRA